MAESVVIGWRRIAAFPASSNQSRVADAKATIRQIEEQYKPGALAVDTPTAVHRIREWRFNLRSSNTEP
jgi:hypothetical protein